MYCACACAFACVRVRLFQVITCMLLSKPTRHQALCARCTRRQDTYTVLPAVKCIPCSLYIFRFLPIGMKGSDGRRMRVYLMHFVILLSCLAFSVSTLDSFTFSLLTLRHAVLPRLMMKIISVVGSILHLPHWKCDVSCADSPA